MTNRDEPTLAERAGRARLAATTYQQVGYEDAGRHESLGQDSGVAHTVLSDLIGDLLHLAAECGANAHHVMCDALVGFEAEHEPVDPEDFDAERPVAVAVVPVAYSVGLFAPHDRRNALRWNPTVEYLGRHEIAPGADLYAVRHQGDRLSADGQWDFEVRGGAEAEWLSRHCFELPTALRLAAKAAREMQIGDVTAQQAYLDSIYRKDENR